MFGFMTKKKAHKAFLGEENTMYYNKELGRWVEPGKENEVEEEKIPPPPKASGAAAATHKRPDEGNPASRYVAAGDFGRGAPGEPEGKKSFVSPPAFKKAPTPTGGFFVPAAAAATLPVAEGENEPTNSPSCAQRYKGYCIPKFTKPEGLPGTQESYAAAELQKFKDKIDRREARKKGSPSTTTEAKENGNLEPARRTNSAKLDNSWLTENGGFVAGTESEGGTQQDGIDAVFGLGSYTDPFAAPQETEAEGQSPSLELFPVETDPTPLNEQTVQSSFLQHAAPETYPVENGTDQWGPEQELVQSEVMGKESSWEADLYGQVADPNELPLAEGLKSAEVQDVEYVEAEFPGSVRDSDDPHDIAWLTTNGWKDVAACRAITVWMCEKYQDAWRTWHKDEPFWDGFWNWYYDGGYEVIHPVLPEQEETAHPADDGTGLAQTEDQVAADFFNAGVEDDISENWTTHAQAPTAETPASPLPAPEAAPTSEEMPPAHHDQTTAPQSPLAPEPVFEETQRRGPSCLLLDRSCSDLKEVEEPIVPKEETELEEFIPESDEDIWKMPEEEEEEETVNIQELPEADKPTRPESAPTVEAAEELVPCPVPSSKDPAIKLSPWEDEFLFSLPDPWAAAPSSEDETDSEKLPFAVFSHTGMLQFLHKVQEIVHELSSTNGGIPPSVTSFQTQVTELIRAVGVGVQGELPGVMEDSSKQDLEAKTLELDTLKNHLMAKETDLNNKLQVAQEENANLKRAYDSVTQALAQHESTEHDLAEKLSQAQGELDQMKSNVEGMLSQLREKDEEIRCLTEDLSDKKSEITLLCVKLKETEDRTVIHEELSVELETLRKEVQDLREKGHASDAVASPVAEMLELRQQVRELQEKLHQQSHTLEEKEAEIDQLQRRDGTSAKNNEIDAVDDWMEQLAEKDIEIHNLKGTLDLKLSRIAALEEEMQQRDAANHEMLAQAEAGAEIERKVREIGRLEQALLDKEADVNRLTSLLESLPKKEGLISKLSAVVGEKDSELVRVRAILQEGRERETDFVARLAAKDEDLESVVHSLMFSQQQVSRLCSYCSDLGGDPHQLLSSVPRFVE